MIRNKLMNTLLVMAATLAFSACTKKKDGETSTTTGSSEATTAGGKKVFRYYRTAEDRSLDPVKQFDQASAEIVMNVYDGLLEYDYLKRPYEMAPNLAEAMPTFKNGDKKVLEFKLKKGVMFIDDECFPGGKGREVKADDVVYSLKRFADANLNVQSYAIMQGFIVGMDEFREETKKAGPQGTGKYEKFDIKGVKKVDDYTIEVHLTRENPLAIYPFAMTQLSIVPHEAVERYGADFERHPVGTGPFKLTQYSRRGVTILTKNPNYHGVYPAAGEGDKDKNLLTDAGKKIPFVDEVQLPLIEESQPRMLKFMSGEIDWVAIDKNNFNKMAYKDDKGYHLKDEYAAKYDIYTADQLRVDYFVINSKDKILGGNKALRQAIAYAIDMNKFIDLLYNGRGAQTGTIVPKEIAGSEIDTKITPYPYDIEMAKKKLKEAGYPEGKGLPPLMFEYRASNTDTRQNFEFIRDQLQKVGIQAKANFQTFSAFLQKVDSGNFQIAEAAWGADYPDAENFFQLAYGPNKAPGPNHGSFDNAEYNKLYEQSKYMANGPDRFKIFARMAEIMKDESPYINIWSPTAVGMNQKWVKNFKRNMMVDAPFKYLDIDQMKIAKGK